MFFDIPHLMEQAGQNPFKTETGISLVQPGPLTHDGLMFNEQDPNEGKMTASAIEHMINDLKTWTSTDRKSLVQELKRSWNEDIPSAIIASFLHQL